MKKRWTSLLSKRDGYAEAAPLDSPEANAARGVKLFCESASPNNAGEEVLHLPVIVEAAESSPKAAAAAATQIRTFLKLENSSRPHVQYNAIMLIRILADNPGRTFTRNFDGKFVATVKDLLRQSRDPSVQQLLRETLDALETEKRHDEGLMLLLAMWRKEKGEHRVSRGPTGPPAQIMHPQLPQQPGHPPRPSHHGLPSPAELVQRIEEARTSAQLLLQLIQSTPPTEVLSSDLIKEFAERCQSAQRSIQGYINSENPAPDDDTLQTLIETNEQLSLACSKHQRAMLQARRAIGAVAASPPPPVAPAVQENGGFIPPSGPPPSQRQPQISAWTATEHPSAWQSPRSWSPPPVPSSMQTRLHQRTLSHEATPIAFAPTPTQPPNPNPFSDESYAAGPLQLPTRTNPAELESPTEPSWRTTQPPVELYSPSERINYSSSPVSSASPSQPPRPPRPPIPAAPPLDTDYTSPPPGPQPSTAATNNINRQSDVYSVSPMSPRDSNLYNSPPVELSAQQSPSKTGFSTTPSYAHRQESSLNHVTISGAGVGSRSIQPEAEDTREQISKEQQPYYHGFNSTPSYMHRQHESINHATMSRAAVRSGSPATRTEEEEEERLGYGPSPTRLRRGDWVDV